MPSTWESIRVSGTMALRGGLLLSPIIASYQGKSLIAPPAPSATTQAILLLLSASALPTFFEFAPMLLGMRPAPTKSPLFFPVTTFVVVTDVVYWPAALFLARRGQTGRGDWLLDNLARLHIASSVLLGLGSVARKYLKMRQMRPEIGWSEKVQWDLLATTLAQLGGATAVALRRRWEQ